MTLVMRARPLAAAVLRGCLTKSRNWFLLPAFIYVALQSAQCQVRSELALPPNGDNERAEVSQWIGLVKITIDYHSPNVHGGGGADRTGHIWGELIAYGFTDQGFGPSHSAPWRVGANETTTITLSHDARVEGRGLKAGTYGLFLDVEKSGPWNWIFSKNARGWGSYQYDLKDDALRVPVNPVECPYTEFMTFGFDERRPSSAVAYLQWEKKRIPFKIEVPDINLLYVERIREDLSSWPGFNYQNWQTAAQFCADNKVNLEEALVWAEKAMHEPFRGAVFGVENFSTLSTKAAVLDAMQRSSDADALMDKALGLPGTSMIDIHIYGIRLLRASRADRALKVFLLNQERHPEERFWTYYGLARAYTNLGKRADAIKNWEIAIANIPENRKSMLPQLTATLKKLKESS
jgi:tetratricopeptide (TPR) repeat protein